MSNFVPVDAWPAPADAGISISHDGTCRVFFATQANEGRVNAALKAFYGDRVEVLWDTRVATNRAHVFCATFRFAYPLPEDLADEHRIF